MWYQLGQLHYLHGHGDTSSGYYMNPEQTVKPADYVTRMISKETVVPALAMTNEL